MRRFTTALVLIAALPLTGCGGENLFAASKITAVENPPTYSAVTFVLENQLGETVDIIADGAIFDLVLDDDQATFESSFRYRELDIEVNGTFQISDDVLALSDDPFEDDESTVQRFFGFARAGDRIFLYDPAAVWDIDGDGSSEIVSMEIELEAGD